MSETVKVILRVRPLNQNEVGKGCRSIIQVDKPYHQLTIANPKTNQPKTFAFDQVYDTDCTQQQIYDESAFPIVESTINGYNGTIFAYGQTGCGKTFTMLGAPQEELRGIIPNSFLHIFGVIGEAEANQQFLVQCSYCEIYNEEIRDLINFNPKTKLELKENRDNGIFIKNLSMHTVKTIEDIERTMEYGTRHRVTKGTDMNSTSSRSHAIFTIYIESSREYDGTTHFRLGKLNLVDLAGSERQKKTNAAGDRLREAIEINLSLSALGNVISALVDGNHSHIPYRDSKLTRLLQDSLGGNTKTVMCAVVSPADYNYDESLSTLRYASRAKFIKNKPRINEDPKDALLRQYAEEIQRLKDILGQGEVKVVERVVEKAPQKQSLMTIESSGINIQQQGEEVKQRNNRQVQSKSPIPSRKHDNLQSKSPTPLKQQESEDNEQKLQSILTDLQQKLIAGGNEIDQQQKDRLKKQRAYRKVIAEQRLKEQQIIEENRRKEEELMNKEEGYQNLNDEAYDQDKVIKKLRKKFRQNTQEIKDLSQEYEKDKANLFQTIRNKEKELSFLHKLFQVFADPSEYQKLKKRSKYDEDNHTWQTPAFLIQNKQVLIPKLPKAQYYEIVQRDMKSRARMFTSSRPKEAENAMKTN